MRKLIALFALLAVAAVAQDDRHWEYVAAKTITLSDATGALTIQQPATGSRTVRLISAYVECSVDCTVTVERDGTAATETALTAARISPTNAGGTVPAAKAGAYHTSDVGEGTDLTTALRLLATEQGKTLDLTGIYLVGDGATKNVTLRSSSITGEFSASIRWEEY